MAQDVHPSSDPDQPTTQQLPPVPATVPGPARTPGSVDPWWTRPASAPADAAAAVPAHRTVGGPGTGRRGIRQAVAARERRRALTVLGIAGALPLLAALAVVLLLPDPPATAPPAAATQRPTQTAASRESREATTAAPSTDPTRPSGQPADLAQVSGDAAALDLGRAGIAVQGQVSAAWGWTGQRGRSLLAALQDVTDRADDGSPRKVSLRVYYVTALDGKPQVLRRLRDSSLSCSDGGTMNAAFTPSAFGVRDLDGDGTAEVVVGWTGHCGDPSAASRIRLAVMSGTELYLLRGNGVPAGTGAATGTASGTATGQRQGDVPAPEPAASRWPHGLLDPTLALFHSVYY